MDARCLIVNAFMLASMERRTRGTGIYIYIYIQERDEKNDETVGVSRSYKSHSFREVSAKV